MIVMGIVAGIERPLTHSADNHTRRCAQHGHVADAAVRRQDHSHFEGWNQLDSFPDLSVRRG
jgi:hypothetical protein